MTDTREELLFEEGVAKSETIDTRKGAFLKTDRFFTGIVGGKLRYYVVERMDAAEFYRRIGKAVAPLRTADDISDDLVRAFDSLTDTDPRGLNCLYMFVTADGRQIHQHST